VDGARLPQESTSATGLASDTPAGIERFRERIVEFRRVLRHDGKTWEEASAK
jgi:hypothetical protein